MQKILLKNLDKPREVNLFNDIEWLGNSLGFNEGRDINGTNNKILKKLLINISCKGNTSTESISNELHMSIQRVNYHLKTLINSGFICREKRLLLLRQGSAKSAIEEMRRDANRIFDNLSIIAESIDNNLKISNRK